MSSEVRFSILKSTDTGYRVLVICLMLLIVVGYYAAHFIETEGHWVTGMNNQVVWGLPHVFAIFLILSASGALNVGSMSSVFGKEEYKPWARFSGLVSVALLLGGLIILVLDLGRPERLIVAITHYNFKSIFAWNIFLYTGFIGVVIVYLWMQFEKRFSRLVPVTGLATFIWRLILTSGTGGIFGFLVARELYDSAMMIPIFIVLSLVLGTAVFILVEKLLSIWTGSSMPTAIYSRLSYLLGIFAALNLFLALALHLTTLYAAEHHGVERFILFDGGVYTNLFWLGQVLLGGIIPIWWLIKKRAKLPNNTLLAVSSVVVGGFSQLYILIIAGQAYPQSLFPGKTVSSSFYDGVVAEYCPGFWELALGAGAVSLSLFMVIAGVRVLPFLPENHS